MGYKVVVVGATGNVGREMLNFLAERTFPFDVIAAVASSAGEATIRASDLENIVTELRRLRNIEAHLVKIGAAVVFPKRQAEALGETTERLGMRAAHEMAAALGREAIRVASIGSVRTEDGSIEHRGHLYAVRPGVTS